MTPIVLISGTVMLGSLGDALSTSWLALKSQESFGDPGRREANWLPRIFLRRFGPRRGPALYHPVEVTIISSFILLIYALSSSALGPDEAQTIAVSSVLVAFLGLLANNVAVAVNVSRSEASSALAKIG